MRALGKCVSFSVLSFVSCKMGVTRPASAILGITELTPAKRTNQLTHGKRRGKALVPWKGNTSVEAACSSGHGPGHSEPLACCPAAAHRGLQAWDRFSRRWTCCSKLIKQARNNNSRLQGQWGSDSCSRVRGVGGVEGQWNTGSRTPSPQQQTDTGSSPPVHVRVTDVSRGLI